MIDWVASCMHAQAPLERQRDFSVLPDGTVAFQNHWFFLEVQ